jgi:uncharacterized protein DUF6441
MKFAATLTRSLQADMQAELRDIERAVAAATRDAGRGLRTELRRQVTSAGLGQRLANSWRDRQYPNQNSTPRAWSTRRRRRSSGPSTRVRSFGASEGAFWRSRPRTHRRREPTASGSARAPSPSTVSGRCGSCLGRAGRRCWSWMVSAPRSAGKLASSEAFGVRPSALGAAARV